jgi:predicted Rossmann fold nucleotide-binding protein DprA/Smf involved in DNA uptake
MMGKNVDSNRKTSREYSNTEIFNRQLSEEEKKIIESISINSKTIEELSLSTQINQVELLELLSILELEGIIETLAGGRFKAVT